MQLEKPLTLHPVSDKMALSTHVQQQIITRGPWATIRSPEQIGRCISTDAMQYSSSIATATRTEIRLCCNKVKGHTRIIIQTNLVELASPIVCTKIQPNSFLGSGKDF